MKTEFYDCKTTSQKYLGSLHLWTLSHRCLARVESFNKTAIRLHSTQVHTRYNWSHQWGAKWQFEQTSVVARTKSPSQNPYHHAFSWRLLKTANNSDNLYAGSVIANPKEETPNHFTIGIFLWQFFSLCYFFLSELDTIIE